MIELSERIYRAGMRGDSLDDWIITKIAPGVVMSDAVMAKHPNRIKSTNKVMKQAKARSIKRSGHKVKPGKGRK